MSIVFPALASVIGLRSIASSSSFPATFTKMSPSWRILSPAELYSMLSTDTSLIQLCFESKENWSSTIFGMPIMARIVKISIAAKKLTNTPANIILVFTQKLAAP